ncbi:phage terminase small subunit [Sporosarcina sp. FSL K6-1508]|uniref:phage terminase small subunit n=1 Tax=Sporosarcina sp. FSL K6-1508 TaxID=2921553 RepID=UPI0030F6D79A
MPDWNEIRQEWETSKITLKALAEKYGVKIGTLKSRRSREKWSRDSPLKKDASVNERDATPADRDATPRMGPPTGNKNAVGNRGGAPKGNQRAAGNRGGRPAYGNKNAVTTGEYETIMWDFLDEDEKELFDSIETDPLYQIDITIRELSLRQRRMMKRIREIEDGLSEKGRRVLQELKNSKDVHLVEKDGVSRKVPINRSALVVTQVEENQFRKIDDLLSIEEALTRITNQLVRSVKQKHDMEKAYLEHPLKLDQLRAGIDRVKAETEILNGEKGNGGADDWVNVLKEVAEKRRAVQVNRDE